MSTPLDHFGYRRGTFSAEKVSLSKLAEEFGTPLYVYSKAAFSEPFNQLTQALGDVPHLLCFAVKANSNLSVLAHLAKIGAGMDLVSSGELKRALRAGSASSKIVFSGVGKTRSEIEEALAASIFSFNVESISELSLLSECAMAVGKTARVALRFNPDVDAQTHPYISTGLKENKFGLDRSEILKIGSQKAKYPGVEISGLSIHIGSQILSLSPFEDAFIKTKRMAAELEKKLGHPLSFLDLGGGVGITYDREKPPTIAAYAKLITKHFGSKSDLKSRYRILLEPGRMFAGNAGVLLSRVLHRKPRKGKDFVIVDAGMNDLARPALYGSYHGILPVEKSRGLGKQSKCDIVGPVCESSDCFAKSRKFPDRLRAGDLIAFLSTGAYGMTMASEYNTRSRPAEILVDQGHYELVRRRETFEEMIDAEVIRGKLK
ncbi:MAG: diaminopimelate decarboxylase [Cryobacterium sp.]|nr:diaminopimelate decarboxylase [Oligoflexia bacterium]